MTSTAGTPQRAEGKLGPTLQGTPTDRGAGKPAVPAEPASRHAVAEGQDTAVLERGQKLCFLGVQLQARPEPSLAGQRRQT